MIRSLISKLGLSSLLGLACLLWCIDQTRAQAPLEPVHIILHLLDYIAVDYPEFVHGGVVLDQAEYDEQLEFSQQVRTILSHLSMHPDKANLLRLADELISGIQGQRPGSEVTALAQQLRWSIIRAYDVEVAPKHPPDWRLAATLYQARCSSCHGLEGRGDRPAAASLEPSRAISTITIASINVASTASTAQLPWGYRAQVCQDSKGSAKRNVGRWPSMPVTSPARHLIRSVVPSCGSLALDGAGFLTSAAW